MDFTDNAYSTIISTALPTIGSDFNQMSIVSWVATAYILTFDAFRKLNDIIHIIMLTFLG
jgi:hypothetical protein